MKNLKLPSSYGIIQEEELRTISGGGELGDALNSFFNNLHLDDLFFGSGLISLSFTFVPMLLFNVVKVGFGVAKTIYDDLSKLFGFSDSTVETSASAARADSNSLF